MEVTGSGGDIRHEERQRAARVGERQEWAVSERHEKAARHKKQTTMAAKRKIQTVNAAGRERQSK